MVFNLAVGFQNVPLSAEDKSSAIHTSPMHKMEHFSMLLADVVAVQKEEFNDVSYSISGDKGDGEEDDEEDEEVLDKNGLPVRRSKRSKDEKLLIERSPSEFPTDLSPGKLKVDMDKEAIIVPINGHMVPFHVSMIKNMTQPDPDLRINFYIPGSALGKEAFDLIFLFKNWDIAPREEEDEESSFEEDEGGSGSDEDSDEDSDDDSDSDATEDEEDEDDEEEELEEKGKLERDAQMEDKMKRAAGDEGQDHANKKRKT
eukprot:gene34444-44504_t